MAMLMIVDKVIIISQCGSIKKGDGLMSYEQLVEANYY